MTSQKIRGLRQLVLLVCASSWLGASANDIDDPLLLHLSFDGSLENHGELGGTAEIVVNNGGAFPQMVEGKFGQGMYFGGGAVLAVPADLEDDDYLSMTMTGWIKMPVEHRSSMTVLSTGLDINLLVHQLEVRATPGGRLFDAKGSIEKSKWYFVAAVFDLRNQRVRIQRDREYYEVEMTYPHRFVRTGLFTNPNEVGGRSQRWLFVGGTDFYAGWAAAGMVIDEVRVYGGALSADELSILANARLAADSPCTAADSAGTYRTTSQSMHCEAVTRSQLQCPYGPDNTNLLSLEVDGYQDRATGTWQQPSGLGGPAIFGLDESCALIDGKWGMSGGDARSPWDSDGEITRIAGGPAPQTGARDTQPPGERGGINPGHQNPLTGGGDTPGGSDIPPPGSGANPFGGAANNNGLAGRWVGSISHENGGTHSLVVNLRGPDSNLSGDIEIAASLPLVGELVTEDTLSSVSRDANSLTLIGPIVGTLVGQIAVDQSTITVGIDDGIGGTFPVVLSRDGSGLQGASASTNGVVGTWQFVQQGSPQDSALGSTFGLSFTFSGRDQQLSGTGRYGSFYFGQAVGFDIAVSNVTSDGRSIAFVAGAGVEFTGHISDDGQQLTLTSNDPAFAGPSVFSKWP